MRPRCAKQAPVNNMNNAPLLKSPAEVRQPAWLRNEPLISLAARRNNASAAEKQDRCWVCWHQWNNDDNNIFIWKKNPVKIHWQDNLQEALLKAERYTNDSRVCSTLKTRDWDGLIHRLWEDKRTEKQADYSEIRIFAWKYKMGHGLGSVYNWGQRWRLTWVSRWQQLSITGAVE